MTPRSAAVVGALLVLVACDGAAAPIDASADAMPDAGSIEPSPPVLTPCPPGWREVTDAHGLTVCEPWPETGHASCAADEMHLPGAPGCARIGTACAADGWPTDLPVGAHVLYVDDDAAPGGDGSTPSRAFSAIAPAISQAATGTIIAVATGHYDEALRLSIAGVTLRGACTSGTILTSSTPATDGRAVLTLAAGDQHVENLSIVDPVRAGVWLLADGAEVSDVVVRGALGIGVGVEARGTLARVAVRGTRTAAIDLPGHGVLAHLGASLTMRQSVLEQNAFVSLAADGAALDVADAAIRETTSSPGDYDLGEGVALTNGATAVLARAVVEGNGLAAVALSDAGSHLEGSDLVLRDTRMSLAGTLGVGLAVGAGATATVTRVRVERAFDMGMITAEPGAVLSASDFVVRDIAPTSAGGGYGASASRDALVTLSRGVIDGASGIGVFGAYSARIDASDLVVRDTRFAPPRADGAGVLGQLDAHIDLRRVRIERSTLFGVGALNRAVITLDGVVVDGVSHTDCCPPETASFGLVADFGGTLSATNFVVSGADVCGVAVGATVFPEGPSSMDLAHGLIAHGPIGACVQADGFDTERLHTDVRFEDVMVPLQATTYSLPAAQP